MINKNPNERIDLPTASWLSSCYPPSPRLRRDEKHPDRQLSGAGHAGREAKNIMKPKIHRVLIFIACIFLSACTKPENRWGGSSGVQALPSEFPLQLCYKLQGDIYSRPFDPATARPQFVVLWKARRAGAISSDGNNRLSEIHGHRISVLFSDKAVYALQPDYTLKRLPLSVAETDQILQSFMDASKASGAVTFDDLWNKSVLPHLAIVEDPTWSPPPIPAKP